MIPETLWWQAVIEYHGIEYARALWAQEQDRLRRERPKPRPWVQGSANRQRRHR